MSRPPVNSADQPDPGPRDTPSGPRETAGRRPPGVYVISAVVGLEALALAGAGVVLVLSAFSQPSVSIGGIIFLIVLVLALAVGLGAVSVNAFKGFRWTRSAAFVWQLLMVALAVPALLNGSAVTGLVALIPALAVIFYLFTPKVVEFTLRAGGEQPLL